MVSTGPLPGLSSRQAQRERRLAIAALCALVCLITFGAVLALHDALDLPARGAIGLGACAAALFLAGLNARSGREVRRLTEHLQRLGPEHARLSLVAQQSPIGVIVTDAARRITWINEGFERLSGWTLADVLGRSPGELLQCPSTDPATVAQMRRALDTLRPVQCEILNRHRDGREYWLELRIQPLFEDGRHIGFMATELNVTARREAESALREREAVLERTGRLAHIGGWAVYPGSREIRWSPMALELLDLQPGHPPSWVEFIAMVGAEWRPRVEELMRPLPGGPNSGTLGEMDISVHTHGGHLRWMRLVAEWRDGARALGMLQDVTDQRAERLKAARDEQVLKSALEAIDEAFVLYGPDDRLVTCNEKYRQVYPLARELMVPGARFEDIIRRGAERGEYPVAVGRVDAWVRERLAQHQAADSTLVQRVGEDRVLRIIERRTKDGHTVGFRFDITELVRAREAAELAARQKSTFIATISHELRTPLQSIIGFSELGSHFAQGHSQFEPMFDDILNGGRRMLTLINGLLDISKFDGTTAVQRRPLALTRLLQGVAHELSPLSGSRGVAIELPHGGADITVHADPFRFQQVVRNVLANALRFAPAGSCVHIGLRDEGSGGVTIAIRDHGPGIPQGELEIIFEPFVQSSRTSDGAGGTGLGLAICRRIMRAHGGRITASLPPGGGALFELWLPPDADPTVQPSQVLRNDLPVRVNADFPSLLLTYTGA